MNCEEIKTIIPAYITHTALEEEVARVEEHLCICNECRKFLSQVLDKPRLPAKEKTAIKEKTDTIEEKDKTKKTGLLEYLILGIGFSILVFFIYLLIKG